MERYIREWLEEREESLSPYAAKSRFARRDRYEEPCPLRTEFQRDRDRIIHCKAFRRLKHKTQVFITPLGDHYVTRLTHTLEVTQIARTIARALNLNEDLEEAICLGHDLGHTPFGHVGEEALNKLCPEGFKHNQQSLRVVEVLEKDGQGLNLTQEVREGILRHSKSRESILGENWESPSTLEGQICKLADTIAYINHDIGDAIRAGIITVEDLPALAIRSLGASHRERINTFVTDVVMHSWTATGLGEEDQPIISLSPEVLESMNILRDFLFKRVYNIDSMREERERAREVVRYLYYYYVQNPNHLPEEFPKSKGGVEQAVVDYIAGMTDQYALRMAQEVIK